MEYIKNHVYSVILAGGSGTRLWPLSSKTMPKQYLSFVPSAKTFLQLTLERCQNISLPQNQIVVTTQEQEKICRAHLEHYHYKGQIIVEPAARNTTAAIALVAWELLQKDADSFMIILPSDHYIQNFVLFESTISDAIELAKQDYFVVIGIQPTHPATEFGYIELGDKLSIGYHVNSFREKPDYSTAEKFLRTNNYLWNAGMFVWKTKTFWQTFASIQPTIAQQIQSIHSHNRDEIYQSLENIPIDISFMEKAKSIACVRAQFDWNDIGSWSAIRECFSQDVNGNSIHGNVHAMNVKNCIVHSSGQFVSVIGLENVGVIVTKDAILVTSLTHAQDVKKMAALFDQIKDTSLP